MKRARLISLHRPDRALARGDGDRSRVSRALVGVGVAERLHRLPRVRARRFLGARAIAIDRGGQLSTRARVSRASSPRPRPHRALVRVRRAFGGVLVRRFVFDRHGAERVHERVHALCGDDGGDPLPLGRVRARVRARVDVRHRSPREWECRPECAFDRHFDARGEFERRDVDQRVRERR